MWIKGINGELINLNLIESISVQPKQDLKLTENVGFETKVVVSYQVVARGTGYNQNDRIVASVNYILAEFKTYEEAKNHLLYLEEHLQVIEP